MADRALTHGPGVAGDHYTAPMWYRLAVLSFFVFVLFATLLPAAAVVPLVACIVCLAVALLRDAIQGFGL